MRLRICAVLLALALAPGLTQAGVGPAPFAAETPELPACEAYLATLSAPTEWQCLGEADLLAPGASDTDWVLHAAWILATRSNGSTEPDQYLYVDQESHRTLYRQRFGPDGSLESAVWVNAL